MCHAVPCRAVSCRGGSFCGAQCRDAARRGMLWNVVSYCDVCGVEMLFRTVMFCTMSVTIPIPMFEMTVIPRPVHSAPYTPRRGAARPAGRRRVGDRCRLVLSPLPAPAAASEHGAGPGCVPAPALPFLSTGRRGLMSRAALMTRAGAAVTMETPGCRGLRPQVAAGPAEGRARSRPLGRCSPGVYERSMSRRRLGRSHCEPGRVAESGLSRMLVAE